MHNTSAAKRPLTQDISKIANKEITTYPSLYQASTPDMLERSAVRAYKYHASTNQMTRSKFSQTKG